MDIEHINALGAQLADLSERKETWLKRRGDRKSVV